MGKYPSFLAPLLEYLWGASSPQAPGANSILFDNEPFIGSPLFRDLRDSRSPSSTKVSWIPSHISWLNSNAYQEPAAEEPKWRYHGLVFFPFIIILIKSQVEGTDNFEYFYYTESESD